MLKSFSTAVHMLSLFTLILELFMLQSSFWSLNTFHIFKTLWLWIHCFYLKPLRPDFKTWCSRPEVTKSSPVRNDWLVAMAIFPLAQGWRVIHLPAQTGRQIGWHSPVRGCHAPLSPLLSGTPSALAKNSWSKPLRVYSEASGWEGTVDWCISAPGKNAKLLKYVLPILIRTPQTVFGCLPHAPNGAVERLTYLIPFLTRISVTCKWDRRTDMWQGTEGPSGLWTPDSEVTGHAHLAKGMFHSGWSQAYPRARDQPEY